MKGGCIGKYFIYLSYKKIMNKSERINDMMFYLNKKNQFNLKDITEKYGVSKRTALRDIQSLEKIGVPIYSEVGRYGKYKIVNKKLLSSAMFTENEIFSLYFGMLTLETYEMCPFNLDKEKLKAKFETCLSKEQLKKLFLIEKILKVEMKKARKNSSLLKDIVEVIIENKICKIVYQKGRNKTEEEVQFLRIFSCKGKWNLEALIYKNGKKKVFECSKIISIEKINLVPLKNLKEIIDNI